MSTNSPVVVTTEMEVDSINKDSDSVEFRMSPADSYGFELSIDGEALNHDKSFSSLSLLEEKMIVEVSFRFTPKE